MDNKKEINELINIFKNPDKTDIIAFSLFGVSILLLILSFIL